jgi:hypothetical protein
VDIARNVSLEYIFAGLLLAALVGLVVSGYGNDPVTGEIRGLLGIAVGVLFGRGINRDVSDRATQQTANTIADTVTTQVKQLTGPLSEHQIPKER